MASTGQPADEAGAEDVERQEHDRVGCFGRHGLGGPAHAAAKSRSGRYQQNRRGSIHVHGHSLPVPASSYDPTVTAIEPTTELMSTSDGLTQLQRRWTVPGPRAAVLLVHGIGEHSGRYSHVGDHLAAAGFDVLAFDNRGFGQSAGRRAFVESFDDYVADVADLLAKRRSLGVPVVLLGHSLGGLICASHATSGRPRPDLLVLSAPALAAVIPRWQRVLAPLLGRLVPRLFVPGKIDPAVLSRDVTVQQAYLDDPLVVSGSTAGLGSEILGAMNRTTASADRIIGPTYVIHGADDELVPLHASDVLAQLGNVERRIWPGLRHECFHEPEQLEVLGELVAWIDGQLQPAVEPPSASSST